MIFRHLEEVKMKWFIVAAMVLVSGCASMDIAKKAVAIKAAEISDTALSDAVWWTCKGASVGSVQRKYGLTRDRADMYKEFCFGQSDANIVGPQ